MADNQCDICGKLLQGHPQCESCGILIGTGHLETRLNKFRGKKICSFCVSLWKSRERKMGRKVLFVELIAPRGVKEILDAYEEDELSGTI